MPRRRHHQRRLVSPATSASHPAKRSAVPARPPISPARRWMFRAVAVVVLPCLLLVLAEVVLRFAGAGYPTDFFVEAEVDGEIRLRTNQKFGYRFFPPKLARTPTQYSFAREKPPGTFRIILFGESAALGDPQPAFGMGRYLQAFLDARYPPTKFEVIPAAMTAINSHALREVARMFCCAP